MDLKQEIAKIAEETIGIYRISLNQLQEHAGIEESLLSGGYAYRQFLELIQNGADAILEHSEQQKNEDNPGIPTNPQIEVTLTNSHLYVANTGAPLSQRGLTALMYSHMSARRGDHIGRFGLGFKSLLKFNGVVDFCTKFGVLQFNPDKCRETLRTQLGLTWQRLPGFRLAWFVEHLNPDEVLIGMEWAETVVRVAIPAPPPDEGPNNLSAFAQLQKEIRNFPAEFLLFFPINAMLLLNDGASPDSQQISVTTNGDFQTLHKGNDSSQWRVFKRVILVVANQEEAAHEKTNADANNADAIIVIDKAAIDDAGHIHARKKVPLVWAAPVVDHDAGQFWAFFPTNSRTHLSGILNAPWKLNNDRTSIIKGSWNTLLMQQAAQLIADSMHTLRTPEDPGGPLDAFPRRVEDPKDLALPLVKALWDKLKTQPVIPDGNGELRLARDLQIPPVSSEELAENWQKLAPGESLKRVVHASCLRVDRLGRLRVLAERLALDNAIQHPPAQFGVRIPVIRHPSDVRKPLEAEGPWWINAIATIDPQKSKSVLKFVADVKSRIPGNQWNSWSPKLKIIPAISASGKFVLISAEQAILAPEGLEIEGRLRVIEDLQADADSRRILKDVLGVPETNPQGWSRILQQKLEAKSWESLWKTLQLVPEELRNNFVTRKMNEIRVQRRSGDWVETGRVLLPGALVNEADDEQSKRVLVHAFHAPDQDALNLLGISEFPSQEFPTALPDDWAEKCKRFYQQQIGINAHLDLIGLHLDHRVSGIHLLAEVHQNALARLTRHLLSGIESESRWWAKHANVNYPEVTIPNADYQYLARHGIIEINGITISLKALVLRCKEPGLAILPDWGEIQPALLRLKAQFKEEHTTVIERPRTRIHIVEAPPLWGLQVFIDNISQLWQTAINCVTWQNLKQAVPDLWAGAARDGVIPQGLPGPDGSPIPLANIFVTHEQTLQRLDRLPLIIALDPETARRWENGGAQRLEANTTLTFAGEPDEPGLLGDLLPELADFIAPQHAQTSRAQAVADLHRNIGDQPMPVPCGIKDGVLLLDQEQLEKLDRGQQLERILAAMAEAGWLNREPAEALNAVFNADVEDKRSAITDEKELHKKLLAAVGEAKEPLLDALGKVGGGDFCRAHRPEILAEDLAKLALAQLGPSALRNESIRAAMEKQGLEPPPDWTSPKALDFVVSLGFPPEFAGADTAKPPFEENISGPIALRELHDYQKEVFEGLEKLFSSTDPKRRAVVSLPTGGGKTRVAVEAAVRLILNENEQPADQNRSVIWIAQSEELCEQAVQAFRQVWLNRGAERTDLKIIRFWGGCKDPAPPDPHLPVVVVSTIQTFCSRAKAERLHWLHQPGLIIIDECHRAESPSYNALTRWLEDFGAHRNPPILGLSATPFRNNEKETARLAELFDNNLLPANPSGLHQRLTDAGILSIPSYETIETGSELTAEEFAELERIERKERLWGLELTRLIDSMNERLGKDNQRNELLVNTVRAKVNADEGPAKSVVFFANSVAHAMEMSARLNVAGIPAAAISGDTPAVARRWFLKKFQDGEIKVLCNHSVLTTGFDAPKTDLVLISRQVFSAALYLQMVGRGLRGEKNGGTRNCTILTVVDNLDRFGGLMAYHYYQTHFNQPTTQKRPQSNSISIIRIIEEGEPMEVISTGPNSFILKPYDRKDL